jgi:nucleoside-diphosphate-sugar epimerase
MSTVFLTGATGLIGSNIARLLRERGDRVRALVRNPAGEDAVALGELGIELVRGDITDLDSVRAAAHGADAVIHSAAMLGGPAQSMEEGFAANVLGSQSVFTAAWTLGISPVVYLSTTTFFDMWEHSLTETTPLDRAALNTDPYSQTKRIAYLEAQGRVRAGQDIRVVVPGGAFGPSPCIARSLVMPSFNERIVAAVREEFSVIVAFPICWVFVDDVANVAIAALDRGTAGERYLALGRAEDVGSMAHFCNRALATAGSSHRIENIPEERLDDPDVLEMFGPSWVELGKTAFPEPWFDDRRTVHALGYRPRSLDEGMAVTIPWMRGQGLIPSEASAWPGR